MGGDHCGSTRQLQGVDLPLPSLRCTKFKAIRPEHDLDIRDQRVLSYDH